MLKKRKISGKLPPPSFWFLFKVFERMKLLIDTEISARYFLTCVGLCLEPGLMMSMLPKHYCPFPCSLLP